MRILSEFKALVFHTTIINVYYDSYNYFSDNNILVYYFFNVNPIYCEKYLGIAGKYLFFLLPF